MAWKAYLDCTLTGLNGALVSRVWWYGPISRSLRGRRAVQCRGLFNVDWGLSRFVRRLRNG